jgi:hypothetical protein
VAEHQTGRIIDRHEQLDDAAASPKAIFWSRAMFGSPALRRDCLGGAFRGLAAGKDNPEIPRFLEDVSAERLPDAALGNVLWAKKMPGHRWRRAELQVLGIL